MNPDFLHESDAEGEMLIAAEAKDAWSLDWFGEGATPAHGQRLTGGRGSVRVLESSLGPLVKRDYLRGGLPRHLSRDRFVWTGAPRTRSFAEFRLLRELQLRGLRVPTAIAARYERTGLLYRASLVMRLIPEARTLAERLAGEGDPTSLLVDVADAVADLHRASCWHADLNAANVLIDAAGVVWLIDFDRARLGVVDAARLQGNLDRLQRSLRKVLPASAMARVQVAWPAMLARYRARLGGVSLPA